MNNKTMKILIVLGIFVAFAFTAISASADYNQCRISSFRISDTNINEGDSIELRWNTENCEYVRITGLGSVARDGASSLAPNNDASYKITAYGSDMTTDTRTINVYVNSIEDVINESNSGTTIVNNYYTTTPASTTKVTTNNKSITKNNTATTATSNTSTKNTDTSKDTETDSVYGGAKDVTGSNLTALSLRGSGSFMPSSIWQWILVVFLILILIILVRIAAKPRPKVHEVHA